MLSPMRKTIADYMAYDEERVELIDGEFLVTPAPMVPHQRIVRNLYRLLDPQIERLKLGESILSPVDCFLADDCAVQPDFVFVLTVHADRVRNQVHGPPDVAMEILSPSHRKRDLEIKLKLYRKHGVPEYWIVDPKNETVTVRVLESGDWRILGAWKRGETAESHVMRGVTAPVDSVFGPRG